MLGIYCRTSKARKEQYTISVQKEKGIQCAKALGYPYRIYVDDGISGTLDETARGGLSDLFQDMKSGELSAVYCIDQSRIERDTQTWLFFVSLIINYKIDYYPEGDKYDLDNPTNRMYAQLMSVVNAYYSEMTSRKVRDANAKKVKLGKTHGVKPYGYQRDELNNYIIFEEEAEHVRRMFDLSLSGCGAYTIANILNAEGIKTKYSRNFEGEITRKIPGTKKEKTFEKKNVTWRGNVISDILKNPMYKGTRIWKMHEDAFDYIDGKPIKYKRVVDIIQTDEHVPPIVSTEIWEKVQLNFENNKKNLGPKEQYHYLLNGLIYCSKCNFDYRGKKRPKGNDFAYKCTNKRYPNAVCDNRGINIPKIETFIVRLLLTDINSFKLFKNIPSKITDLEVYYKSLKDKKKEVDKISKNIKNLILLAKEIKTSDFKEISTELTNLKKNENNLAEEIIQLERKIKDYSSGSFDQKLKESQDLMKRVSAKISNTDNFELIKALVHSLIDKIIVEYQPEFSTYKVEVILKGKELPLIFETNRYSDYWVLVDSMGNKEFTVENKPVAINGIALVKKVNGQHLYQYGIKIPKDSYLNFD
jgi:DNA invertase Pin-like site-specific DNA recombinase